MGSRCAARSCAAIWARRCLRFAPFDCIVANLPYVPTAHIAPAPDPVAYEPRVALDGGPDGLDLYRRLLAELPGLVGPGSAVFFEAAPPTMPQLRAAIAGAFPEATPTLHADYGGRERYVRFNFD